MLYKSDAFAVVNTMGEKYLTFPFLFPDICFKIFQEWKKYSFSSSDAVSPSNI